MRDNPPVVVDVSEKLNEAIPVISETVTDEDSPKRNIKETA